MTQKKTWQVMKEITGKRNRPLNNLTKMLKSESETICDQEQIANKFNKFFTNVGPNLLIKSLTVINHLTATMNETNIDNFELSFEEFENAFVKRNKASGIDNISSNIIIDVYDGIKQPLFQIFKSSLNEWNLP